MTLCIAAILFLCMIAAPVSVFGFSSEELQTSCCEEENLSVRVQQNELKSGSSAGSGFSYLIVTFMDSEGGVPDPVLPQKVADGTAYYSFSDKEDGFIIFSCTAAVMHRGLLKASSAVWNRWL